MVPGRPNSTRSPNSVPHFGPPYLAWPLASQSHSLSPSFATPTLSFHSSPPSSSPSLSDSNHALLAVVAINNLTDTHTYQPRSIAIAPPCGVIHSCPVAGIENHLHHYCHQPAVIFVVHPRVRSSGVWPHYIHSIVSLFERLSQSQVTGLDLERLPVQIPGLDSLHWPTTRFHNQPCFS